MARCTSISASDAFGSSARRSRRPAATYDRSVSGPELRIRTSSRSLATDARRLERLFGDGDDLLPLWIAEPYVDLAPGVTAVLEARAGTGWYGYETRPHAIIDAFWLWMAARHGWDGSGLHTSVSPRSGSDSIIFEADHSWPGFFCHHDHCSDRNIRDVIERHENELCPNDGFVLQWPLDRMARRVRALDLPQYRWPY